MEQEPISNKSNLWLWIVFIAVLIAGAIFFYLNYSNTGTPAKDQTKTAAETNAQVLNSNTADLKKVDQDLQGLDESIGQIDKIDENVGEDTAPTL